MISSALIGSISLNLSTFLYFTCYLPQLIHNKRAKNLNDLSLCFHFILFIDYLLDLIYAFALELPWQYKLVSLVGVIYLSIQHRQLSRLKNRWFLSQEALLGLFVVGFFVYFLPLSQGSYLSIGYLVHLLNTAFYLPQIFKNYHSPKAALSLSFSFLVLHLMSVLLDNINAWCLSWPLPSKIGAFTTSILSAVLFLQWFRAFRAPPN